MNISASSVLRILKKYGLTNCKPTIKPGLNDVQRAARYYWCLKRSHWTLENVKPIIWSNETSVILGHRRDIIRVWRSPQETLEKTVIRRR
jgi:hypothetical protein